ncbi:DNA alkylation repair protein [Methylophaga nitratireducenticrescens]|uniref:DNA alkylation repair enzyme n=1 Tax=Methylophaga nitratireducenticrescens TaxID=754476 RepID=I1XIK0_METNJ|nr:DNA alkylation repair protein [Methylophaga nitratireducenticrescens]AFI84219.1 DNA alkylation repair protein [Methylophaga nitratireducenticrescens]AUZ84299.1 DNA alkylation repair protein [Methylophaga nitratireducenticrescens]
MAKSDPLAESPPALLKDYINANSIEALAGLIKQYKPDFPDDKFRTMAMFQLEPMSLKTRVNHISDVLAVLLVDDFSVNAKWLKQVAEHWPNQEPGKGWHSFMAWPLIDYAGKQGLQQPTAALDVLKHLTPLFTAEFAIRPYIQQHFELTFKELMRWCEDDNEHVRRLASEGMRPRLPWGGHLNAFKHDPQPVFEILSQLRDDKSKYVQKSVANNLNDISKDHPHRVIDLCREWLENSTPQRRWIIRHGLRSLIKAGEPAVFPLLGYSEKPAVNVDFNVTDQHVRLGQKLEMQTFIHSKTSQAQQLVVDYRVWHVKSNGKTTAKVYKWKNITLLARESVYLKKLHGFLQLTTRQYYGGQHTIEILINGVVHKQATVNLVLE